MTRRIRPALVLLTITIASVTPTSPPATAAPVSDSPHEGVRAPGVESGTENSNATWTTGPDYNETARSVVADDPIIGDSPHEGVRAPGVESGTENELACKDELACKLDDPIIGDPAHSDVQYAEVTERADRLAQVAVGLPPVPGRP